MRAVSKRQFMLGQTRNSKRVFGQKLFNFSVICYQWASQVLMLKSYFKTFLLAFLNMASIREDIRL
jgi:hypothetical protein